MTKLNQMRGRAFVVFLATLAGCATQPPSPQAPTRVRLISAEQA